MTSTTLITGGCRSGKSRHALALASEYPGEQKVFVATCVADDEEMRRRVARHQRERGPAWQTIEEPVDLQGVIERQGPGAALILIDCLTLWISNLMALDMDEIRLSRVVAGLCRTIAHPPCALILVTNEVGCGIVPENPLARRFRDMAGWANQQVAAVCTDVIWMVSGLAVTVKPGHASARPGKD